MDEAAAALAEHPHARAVLGPVFQPGGRASHAYLFHGPAGAGKRRAARALAAALLAEGAADPAGVARRVESGSHPDLTWVAPSGAHEMLVGDIDAPVVAAASHTPFEAQRRVFVLEGADRLVEAAANKLLKTLEEPPSYVHLVLLTDRPGEVMATIASRCQPVRFEPPSAERLAERLARHGVGPEAGAACARLALGDGERALALALGDGPALRAAAEAFARAPFLEELAAPRDLLTLARAAGERATAVLDAELADRRELTGRADRRRLETEYAERTRRARRRAETGALDLALQLVSLWYRDLVFLALGADELMTNVDRADALRADAAVVGADAALGAVELVEETRQRLQFNVSEELALDALASRLARALRGAG